MGLDLLVRVQSDFRTDEQGRDVWTVTQLCNLRRCNIILDQLSNRLEFGFSNCATHSFYGETFHEILEQLQEELTELTELSKVGRTTDYQERRIVELADNAEMLEEFISVNEVPNNDTQSYEVHAWW